MPNAVLAVSASVCLLIALAQSWMIVATLASPEGPVGRFFPNSRELIRSHIDYLMMAQFQFVFYGLFRLMALTVPIWLVALICFGSFFNPFAFFVRAVKPSYITAPPGPFTLLLTISCLSTTVGYAVAAVMLAQAALAAA